MLLYLSYSELQSFFLNFDFWSWIDLGLTDGHFKLKRSKSEKIVMTKKHLAEIWSLGYNNNS